MHDERPVSSPVCYRDLPESDPQEDLEVARWRKSERARLLDARKALSVQARADWGQALMAHLRAGLPGWLGDPRGRVISGYWPIKGEADLRPWLAELDAAGAIVALPVVEERAAPLVFRRWRPGAAMERGHWNIPVPPESAAQVVPELALAPLVGWDGAGYRLGYGGGYFDRTLAALSPRPFVVGVGLQAARLPGIFPRWHDVAMSAIVTEAGIQVARAR